MMTPRARYQAILNFEKPDKIPWTELFDREALLQWVYQGKVNPYVIQPHPGYCEPEIDMITNEYPISLDFPVDSMFGCIDFGGLVFPTDKCIIPRYTIKRITDTDDYYEIKADSGVHIRRTKHAPSKLYNMAMFSHWPVKDKESWEEFKKRLDPKDPRRLPKDWDPDGYTELFKTYQAGLTKISSNGLYGFGAQLMGMERWNTVFFENPDLANDIADFWEYFTIELHRPILDTLGKYIDTAHFWEDMAEKHGPFVSRRTYEKFFLPRYKRINRFFREKGIKHSMVDTDGNIFPLLDLFVEGGIDGLWPLEVAAGMDVSKVREKFGKQLWLCGNINKMNVCVGGETMRKEVDRKLAAAEEGGYAPGLDHLVPIQLTYDKFIDYSSYMKAKLNY